MDEEQEQRKAWIDANAVTACWTAVSREVREEHRESVDHEADVGGEA